MADHKRIAIAGAGLGGICAGIHLTRAGIDDFVILERAAEPGGTWRDNTYPGCACDVPVALYQFSFAPSLHWRHVFPRSAEMKQYIDQLVTGFSLTPRFRGGDGVQSAMWDDDAGHWRIRTESGAQVAADALIVALGQLNRPMLPDIEGRDSFAGSAFHSARWDHSVSLEGQRVGVIGSAASAVQLIPEVANMAGHLTVFQRTPNWLLPRNDREITAEEMALLMTAPHVAELTREQLYQNADYLFWQAFSWTTEGRAAFTRQATMHLEAQVSDPVLRQKLTPDYPIGCKPTPTTARGAVSDWPRRTAPTSAPMAMANTAGRMPRRIRMTHQEMASPRPAFGRTAKYFHSLRCRSRANGPIRHSTPNASRTLPGMPLK